MCMSSDSVGIHRCLVTSILIWGQIVPNFLVKVGVERYNYCFQIVPKEASMHFKIKGEV